VIAPPRGIGTVVAMRCVARGQRWLRVEQRRAFKTRNGLFAALSGIDLRIARVSGSRWRAIGATSNAVPQCSTSCTASRLRRAA